MLQMVRRFCVTQRPPLHLLRAPGPIGPCLLDEKTQFLSYVGVKKCIFRLKKAFCHFFNKFFEENSHNILISWKKYIKIYKYEKMVFSHGEKKERSNVSWQLLEKSEF